METNTYSTTADMVTPGTRIFDRIESDGFRTVATVCIDPQATEIRFTNGDREFYPNAHRILCVGQS